MLELWIHNTKTKHTAQSTVPACYIPVAEFMQYFTRTRTRARARARTRALPEEVECMLLQVGLHDAPGLLELLLGLQVHLGTWCSCRFDLPDIRSSPVSRYHGNRLFLLLCWFPFNTKRTLWMIIFCVCVCVCV